jgi:site-specific DNA-methyltransferase (adenine-specific)
MEETIGGIEHVDHILTDPPYLYIKTHDFDRPWDEQLFFENAKRLLPDDGFIALFGRGTSFYRWNTRLADLGFVFKEEIVWNKKRPSSPSHSISRVHETVSLHTKKTGIIRHVKIPYEEQQQDFSAVLYDIKQIKTALLNGKGIADYAEFQKTGKSLLKPFAGGIHITHKAKNNDASPFVSRLIKIKDGMREKTIITVSSIHYGSVHPTEKPVRLAERVLALISEPGDTIYDPFMGSGSFGVACINTGRKYIGSEMKPEYFDIACKRIKEAVK